jgi:hypothetical protein
MPMSQAAFRPWHVHLGVWAWDLARACPAPKTSLNFVPESRGQIMATKIRRNAAADGWKVLTFAIGTVAATSGWGSLAVLAAPAAASEFPIVIRTYDASGLPDSERAAALAAATAILEDARIAVARLACENVDAAPPDHPCRVPLRPNELSLRLVRLAASDRGTRHVTLGYSLLETDKRAGALATVYVDRVADLAAASRVEMPTLLGRAIAHEIGHLLLGTRAHAPAGVMRAAWSRDALRHSTPREWRFTPADAEALRAAARRRAAHVPGGPTSS